MVFEHDYKEFPELSNSQIQEFGFTSPHVQIQQDFLAEVVKVIDGDTIRLKTDFRDFDFPLRFLDIDAPELNEGGETTKNWLQNRIEGKIVEIKINIKNRVDKFGRLLGWVIRDGLNVGEEMLLRQFAKPFSQRNEGKLPNLNEVLNIEQWL